MLRCAEPPLARFGNAQHTSASLLGRTLTTSGPLFFRIAFRLQIDAEMLAFLVQVTAL